MVVKMREFVMVADYHQRIDRLHATSTQKKGIKHRGQSLEETSMELPP